MKQFIVMRGLPGSGKSTKAKRLREETLSAGKTAVIHSADDFFTNENGEYNYDIKAIPHAHADCFQQTVKSFIEDFDVVILDNTNVKKWHFEHYVATAKAFDYQVLYCEMPHLDTDELVERNIHGVPSEAINWMRENWEEA